MGSSVGICIDNVNTINLYSTLVSHRHSKAVREVNEIYSMCDEIISKLLQKASVDNPNEKDRCVRFNMQFDKES
jgi:hypothetical protein